MRKYKLISMLLLLVVFLAACADKQTSETTEKQSETKEDIELTISAAASLKDAMDVIQNTYKEEHPEVTLNFNFGGSGSLQQQISQGAPVDLFFSAAEDKFDLLVEEGNIALEDGVDLLGNTLVLIVPKEGGSTIQTFEDLKKENIDQISIGTPETVPAGKYAQESLESLALWKEIEPKVVYAKDVTQVLSYVETGNVSAGIVYKTDGIGSDKVNVVATADPVTHTPIIYPVGIIKDSAHYEESMEFYNFLQSDAALKVFEDYGFIAQ